MVALRNAIVEQFIVNAKQWMDVPPSGSFVPPAISMQVIGRQVVAGGGVECRGWMGEFWADYGRRESEAKCGGWQSGYWSALGNGRARLSHRYAR